MVADEHDGAAVGVDLSKRDWAVSQQTNELHELHTDPAGQLSLHTRPSNSTSRLSPPNALRSPAVLSTNAAYSTGEGNVINAESTDHGSTIAGRTVGKGSKNQRRSSTTPALSIDTLATSRRDTVLKSRGPPISPVSPESPPHLSSPISPSRSPSSSRTRDRGFSLRRAILARNIQGQPENSGSAIELQPTAASAAHQAPADSGPAKKSETKITVLPVFETGADLVARPDFTKFSYESLALPRYEIWIKQKAAHNALLSRLRTIKEKIRKKILGIQEIPPSYDGRHIDVDPARREPLIDERTGRGYIKNTITSSRYTLYNFIPRQLFAQFSKLANFYFLCVSILQLIPGLSTTGSYTTIVPLAFFVVISMAKEGYDDLRRYRLDRAENRKTAMVLCGHKASAASADSANSGAATAHEWDSWAETRWEDIEVGDVVKLARDGCSPADLVVLHINGAEGIAYVETVALDGETNLKSKQALPQLARSCRTVESIASCKAHIVVEDPNMDLYNFEGKVTVGNETLPLANNEIIYRGSVLRNTTQAIGVVVYSGEECKIRMNATKNPRIKAVSTKKSCDKRLKMVPADM